MADAGGRHYVLSEADAIDVFLLPGWRAEVEEGKTEMARADMRRYLDMWCDAGLPASVEDGRRSFDPVDLNFACERGLAGLDDFWHRRAIAPRRAAVSRYMARSPMAPRYHDPRRIEIRLRREFYYPDRAPGSRMLVSFAVPVEGPTQQRIIVTPSPLTDSTITVKDGLLVARTRVREDRSVRIDTRIELVGYQHTVEVDASRVLPSDPREPALLRYLARSEGIIRVTPYIESVVPRIRRTNAYDTLLAIWDFMLDERRIGAMHHHVLDPEDPLGSSGRWLDCYVGSALFVALARAAGIPARMVHGALLSPSTDMGHHYWVEAFVPPFDWIPFDLRGWALAAGDRRDPTWGRFLAGHLPYQLVYQHLPAERPELSGTYPRRWYSLARLDREGQWSEVYDLDTRALVLRDYCQVTISEPLEP